MPRLTIFRNRSKGKQLIIRVGKGKDKDKDKDKGKNLEAESEQTAGLDSLRNIGAIISPASSTRCEDGGLKLEWQDTMSVSSDSSEDGGFDRYTSVFQSPIKPSIRRSGPMTNPDFVPNPLHRQPRRLQVRLDLPQGKYSKNKIKQTQEIVKVEERYDIQRKQAMEKVEERDNDRLYEKLGIHSYREFQCEPGIAQRSEAHSEFKKSGVAVDAKDVAVISPLSEDNTSSTLGMKIRPVSDDQKIKVNPVNSIAKIPKRIKRVHFSSPKNGSDGAGKQGSVDYSREGSQMNIPAEYVFTFESSEVSDEDDITFHSTRSPIRLQQECKDLEAACSTFNHKLQKRAQKSKPYQLISRSLSCLKDRGNFEVERRN